MLGEHRRERRKVSSYLYFKGNLNLLAIAYEREMTFLKCVSTAMTIRVRCLNIALPRGIARPLGILLLRSEFLPKGQAFKRTKGRLGAGCSCF